MGDWWAPVVQARTQHADLLPQRVWALRKNGHRATVERRAVPGVAAELVLSVDGELRRARLYRAHEQAELSGAIADTRARFEAKGWANVDDTERAELIAALHESATFAESLLDLNERLLDALTTGENRPDAEELEYLRAGLSRWREQLATLRHRINTLTIEPPTEGMQ